MTAFPTLETERLVLRGWREKDLKAIVEVFSDAQHARYIGGKLSEETCWRMMAKFIGHQALRGFSLYAVEEKKSNICIGWAGPWCPKGWPENEIGYTLVPSATGQGYAREAAGRALQHAYNDLGWTTAISLIDSHNEGSKTVARSLGAIHDGDATVHGEERFDAQVWRHLPPDAFRKRMEGSLH
ncbi:GNAT family N-acetyltransferase [Pseudahrensia aquimaris]|uniref:GNAT family N-acetyltransferase n=1 Tax=Pseudahrensia aquimaris TaxID=744461 RepID=A0ABW3FC46_9HYPH